MPVNTRYFLPQTKEITTTIPFVELGANKQIKLELPGYYTEGILTVSLNVTPATTVTPATDWDAMILKGMKIKADNSRPFLDLDDGRELKYHNIFASHGSIFIPDLPEGGGDAKDCIYRYKIHLGDHFTNPYDVPADKVAPPSEVIATRDLANLVFSLDWGKADPDLGTGFTIDAAASYASLTISYLLLQPGISEALAFSPQGRPAGRVGFFQPGNQIQRERNIQTTYSNLGYECNLLNGFWFKDVFIFATRDTGGAGVLELVDDMITKFQLTTKDKRDLYTKSWAEQQLVNAQKFQLSQLQTGVIHVDVRDIFGAGYEGVYVKNAGDYKWKFTIENVDAGNPGHIIIVYITHDVAEALSTEVGKRAAVFGV